MSEIAPSLTKKVVAAISGGPCAAVLKPSGFRRKAPNFWRETEDIFQCVNFQASQWGSNDAGSFTINLGVTSPTLYKAFTGRSLPKNPAGLLWPINRRIGGLTPNRCDMWWSVGESTDLEQLGLEVAATIEKFALPFLDSLRTPQQIQAALSNEESVTRLSEGQLLLVRASLAAQLGDSETARVLLDEAIQSYKGTPFEATVHRTAEALASHL